MSDFRVESDVPDEYGDHSCDIFQLTSKASPTHSSIERKKSTDSSGSVLKINLNIEKRFEYFSRGNLY